MINKDILKGSPKEKIKERELYEAYKIFLGTFVSEPRLKILNLLRKRKRNVSEIIEQLNMDQTSVSHNLARLKKCGFVEAEINGKFRYYKINEITIKPLLGLIDKHMSSYCIHILRKSKGGKKK
jgi:DNA-binding transcriptional ArsR family regulator